jgi:FKBP-type peptidyl-prolyl cis-trans isomerase FklB
MNTKTATLTLLTGLLTASAALAEGTNLFKNDQEKIGYAIGLNIGNNWKQQELDVDYEMLLRGIKDAKAGGATLITEAESRDTLNKLSQEIRARFAEKQRRISEQNKTNGEAFLAANKTKPGVISLPNGLQYKVLAEGKGDSPKPEDTVEVNYRGSLIDGTEFDSNAKTEKPYTTPANRVIRGWTEALTRMKPGAKWQLFIPSDLAYAERGGPPGERGSPPKIGPNATLLFDVELLSFKPAPIVTNAPPSLAQPLTSDIIKVPSLEEMKKGAKIETIKAEDVEKLQKQSQEKK